MITIVDDRNLSFALGASDYLTKPIDREQLAAVLRRLRSKTDNKSVLIVEDEPGARKMMRRLFEKEGWSVNEAENGRVGLEAVAEHAPGLVLLDLMMPEMDGFEFIEHLRRSEEGTHIPVVVLTAKDLTERDRQRLRGSVENVLQKTGQSNEVVKEVRRLLEQSAAVYQTDRLGALTGVAESNGASGQLTGAEISNLRHELRTPVNQIVGYCEMLLEDADEPEYASRQQPLRDAIAAVRDVLKLIDSALPTHQNSIGAGRVASLYESLKLPQTRILDAMSALAAGGSLGAGWRFHSGRSADQECRRAARADRGRWQRPPIRVQRAC